MFDKLFEPITVGPIHLKNRLQLLPHNTLYDVRPSPATWNAGRGEGSAWSRSRWPRPSTISGEFPDGTGGHVAVQGVRREVVPHYSRLCEGIHRHGAKAFIELSAAGGNRGAVRSASSVPGGMKASPRGHTTGRGSKTSSGTT